MKEHKIRFIKKLTIFLILVAITFLLLNLLYEHALISKTSIERTDAQFYEHMADTKIIILEASHAKRAVNPTYLNDSFNFASSGESYIQTYYKVKAILEYDAFEPQVFILTFDPHIFSSYSTYRYDRIWYWIKYVDFYELHQADNNITYIDKYIRGTFPLIGGGSSFIDYYLLGKKSDIIKGFESRSGTFSSSEQDIIDKRVSRHFKNAELFDELKIEYFKKILDLAEQHNITVVLVKYPLTKAYINATNAHIPNMTGFYDRALDSISPYTFHVLDYQDMFIDQNAYFADPDHLNIEGAKLLTQQLDADLRNLSLVE